MINLLRFFFKRLGGAAPSDGPPSATFNAPARSTVWSAPARGVVFKPQQDS